MRGTGQGEVGGTGGYVRVGCEWMVSGRGRESALER